MNTINPGKTILSKTSYHSRYICSTHHLSVKCSINCIFNVTYLMTVSMTAEMTSSQNLSDSQTTAARIMFTCFQAVVVFLISLVRQRTSGILSEKFHILQTFFLKVLQHSHPYDFILFQLPCNRSQLQKLQSSPACCNNSPLRGVSASYKSEGVAGKLSVILSKSLVVTCWNNTSAPSRCSPSHSGRIRVWHWLEKGRSDEHNWISCTLA